MENEVHAAGVDAVGGAPQGAGNPGGLGAPPLGAANAGLAPPLGAPSPLTCLRLVAPAVSAAALSPPHVLLRVSDTKLGDGSFSTVHEALYYGPSGQSSPTLCAVKVFQRDDEYTAKREAWVLSHLWRGATADRRPLVVQPLHLPSGAALVPAAQVCTGCDLSKPGGDGKLACGDTFYLPLELAKGRTLGELLAPPLPPAAEGGGGAAPAAAPSPPASPVARIPVEVLVTFMHQLAGGLLHCHEKGVIHYDLKPEQVLLLSPLPPAWGGGGAHDGPAIPSLPVLVLCDFGSCMDMYTPAWAPDVVSPLHPPAPELVSPNRKPRRGGTPKCANCEEKNGDFVCGACKGVAYCGSECSKAHWGQGACVVRCVYPLLLSAPPTP
jgi:serine/threonine protein kinase